MTGISRSYMGKIEFGRSNISLDYLEKIVEGLGITFAELFEGVGREAGSTQADEF